MIKLNVNSFRAIANATIKLDGISVLTGVNASGKSTLSRILYYTLYYSQNFEELLEPYLYNRLEPIVSLYRRLLNSLLIRKGIGREDFIRLREVRDLSIFRGFRLEREKHLEILDLLIEFFEEKGLEVRQHERDSLGGYIKKRISNRYAFIDSLYQLKNDINTIYDAYNRESIIKDPRYLSAKLREEFGGSELEPGMFSISEEEESVIDFRKRSIGKISSIDKAYYIDTPVVVNLPLELQAFEGVPLHWMQLMKLFVNTPVDLEDYWSDRIGNIVKGRALVLKPSEGINRSVKVQFITEKGDDFPLREAATGIKSFVMLQLLLQKGFLDENTLLIIDEPEAHLHPQWIVEYAKLIVELNQKLGVRFLIATHSTDMVQALSVLKNTGVLSNSLVFYLAKEVEKNKFEFVDCEGDIEPIFQVFNKSLDSIVQLLGENK